MNTSPPTVRIRGPREDWTDRFDRLVEPGPNGCLNWIGTKNDRGYGQFHVHGVGARKAHRVAYEAAFGPVGPKILIDHKCHNTSCVNLEHLRAVTPKQNAENHSPQKVQSKTGFRGVTYRKETGKYRARVRHNNVLHSFGAFDSAEEAAEAARQGRMKLFSVSDGR